MFAKMHKTEITRTDAGHQKPATAMGVATMCEQRHIEAPIAIVAADSNIGGCDPKGAPPAL